MEEANRFLHDEDITAFNRRFQVPATQRGTAFTACPRRDLDLQAARLRNSNVRSTATTRSVFSTSCCRSKPGPVRRGTLAGCTVSVHQHLNGTLTLTFGPHLARPRQHLGPMDGSHQQSRRQPNGGWAIRRLRRLENCSAIPIFRPSRRLHEIKSKPDRSRATESGTFSLANNTPALAAGQSTVRLPNDDNRWDEYCMAPARHNDQ